MLNSLNYTDNIIGNVTLKHSQEFVPYTDALSYMEETVEKIIKLKSNQEIWFLEHDNLFTYGTSAQPNEILDTEKFPIFKAGRGGRYTYHGPGMRILYLMLNLDLQKNIGKDVRKYVYNLEQVIINSLAYFTVKSERKKDRIGIWVQEGDRENKIAAIGIRLKKWVSYHGVSVNINPNLENFNSIIPCGINSSKYGVTSLWELGFKITLQEFDEVFTREFFKIFL